jgi:hypothetical protein
MLTAATHHVFLCRGFGDMGEFGFHAKKNPAFRAGLVVCGVSFIGLLTTTLPGRTNVHHLGTTAKGSLNHDAKIHGE